MEEKTGNKMSITGLKLGGRTVARGD